MSTPFSVNGHNLQFINPDSGVSLLGEEFKGNTDCNRLQLIDSHQKTGSTGSKKRIVSCNGSELII